MDWGAAQAKLREPIFAPLKPALARLPAGRWPDHGELTAAAGGIATSRGKPIRFVPPTLHTEGERRYYELHIADTGEIETRGENWHDLFNALVWMTFPRSKAAINAQHAAILQERGETEARHRSPERDALTLFDEGGVVVTSSSPDMQRLIAGFAWKEVFWRRREELQRTTAFTCFGHACYEQALEPYVGMVAKTVFLPPGPVDELLAAHFAERTNFASPRAMAPMPVLGVPGWYPQNTDERFYDDERYFRPKRR